MRSYWVAFERIILAVLVFRLRFCGTGGRNTGILRCAQADAQEHCNCARGLGELCGGLDGVEDAHVAGAAAEVSGEAFLDL